ncbi:MAG: hypothetical protein HOP09_12215 [Hyphomicrobium sp.]|nr:hypothetical protein [Hyphomicrobium sp.]
MVVVRNPQQRQYQRGAAGLFWKPKGEYGILDAGYVTGDYNEHGWYLKPVDSKVTNSGTVTVTTNNGAGIAALSGMMPLWNYNSSKDVKPAQDGSTPSDGAKSRSLQVAIGGDGGSGNNAGRFRSIITVRSQPSATMITASSQLRSAAAATAVMA